MHMEPKFIITLCIGLAIQLGGAIWWLAGLSANVQHNDFQIQMIEKDVNKNSNFVELWPSQFYNTCLEFTLRLFSVFWI